MVREQRLTLGSADMNHRFQQLHPPQRVRAHAAAAFLLLGLIGPGAAERAHANISWSNATGGNFSHGPNWSGGTAPTGVDTAVFDLPGPYTVTFDQPTSDSDKLRVDAGEVAFDFADPSYTHTVGNTSPPDPGLRIGFLTRTPSPELTLTGGGTLNAGHTIVGDDALGELIVDGPGTKLKGLRSAQGVVVGHGATGNMTVRNGAIVDVNKVVFGASSSGTAGFGDVLITGAQTTWNSNNTRFEHGDVRVEQGAVMSVHGGGIENNSTLTVDSAGSRFKDNAPSVSGHAFSITDGRINVLNGGDVKIPFARAFGWQGGGNEATINIDGTDGNGNPSRLFARTMTIGRNTLGGAGGEMYINVTDGGLLQARQDIYITNGFADGFRSVVRIAGSGSTLEATSTSQYASIEIGGSNNTPNTDGGDAYVTVADGGVIRTNPGTEGTTILAPGRLSGNGTVEGDLTNRGYVSPSMRYQGVAVPPGGNNFALQATRGPASEMTIEGDYEQSAGATLDILLDDAAFDRLLITDDAVLDGGLTLSPTVGFAPDLGDVYKILDVADTISGQFTGLPEGALAQTIGGVDLFISYAAGDGNDVALYTTVPEPTTAAMLALAALGLAARRRGA